MVLFLFTHLIPVSVAERIHFEKTDSFMSPLMISAKPERERERENNTKRGREGERERLREGVL